MDNEKFKNTKVMIKDGKMYMEIDLSVKLEQDTINMRGNNKNDAIAIANTYQQDVNDKYHINVQVNTNTKANKDIFKAKKAKAKTTTKKTPAKKKTPKKVATKTEEALLINEPEGLTDITEGLTRMPNGMMLDLTNKWDAIKAKQILARSD